MTVEVLNETATKKEVKISVSKEDFQKKYEGKVKKLAKTIKLEGFRKGKVPVSLVKKRFGKSLKAEVTEELAQETYNEHLNSLDLTFVKEPVMNDFKQEKTGEFQYTLNYEFIPEFDLGEYKGLNIEIEVEKFTEEDFNKYLNEKFLPGFSKRVPVEDRETVQEGDVAIIDISVADENDSLNKTDFPLEVGKDVFKGIDEVIIGKKIGDEFEFDYVKENSDTIKMTIKIVGLEVFKTPELNEEFVEQYFSYGREEYGVEEFLNDLKKEYKAQIESKNNSKMLQKYLDIVPEKYDFEIPDALMEAVKNDFLASYIAKNGEVQDKEAFFQEHKEEIEKLAKRHVFILRLKAVEDIQVYESDLIQYYTTLVKNYGIPEEEAVKYITEPTKKAEVLYLLENNKIEKFIVENNNFVDISASGDSSEDKKEEE
jgi:trigger factor